MKWNIAATACCVLLLILDVALLRQNRQLKAQLSAPPAGLEVQAGIEVPDLKGFDAAGMPLTVRYGQDSRKVLLLVFSPACKFCAENWPRWEALLAGFDRQAVRPVGVDISSTASQAFLREHRMSELPVFLQLQPQAIVKYRLQITPQTILVDGKGRVEKVWSGVLDDSSLTEVKNLVRSGAQAGASSVHRNDPGF